MLIELKDKVENTLASYEISENQQQTTIQEEEIYSKSKRGRKKRTTAVS
jgi:hypothetical protein